MPLWRQLRALLLPITVDGLIPALIVYLSPTPAALRPWELALIPVGLVLLAIGLPLMVGSIYLFMTEGRGTLAPWDPPQRLVVRGVYRYVRNPMISGLLAILLAEAAFFVSPGLLVEFGVAALLNAVYIPRVEEPGLLRRFGADYDTYRRHVPRWLPRLRPWQGS